MTTQKLNSLQHARSLDQLKVGESGFVGKVHQIANAISQFQAPQFDPQFNQLVRRLMEIGFIPGEPLQVLHKGFFGGEPIAVRIGQSTFALRRCEAALISVIPHEKQ